jgi:predicted deacylase
VPVGNEDLNRIFPGDPNGSPASRTAHAVYTAIKADAPVAHIDLHTDSVLSVPYCILDRALSRAARAPLAIAERLARAGGQEILFDWPLPEYRRLKLDRSLSGTVLNQAHVPSFTMELGPTRVAERRFVESGLDAVLAAMRELGMLPGERASAPERRAGPRRYRLPGLTVNHVGLLRLDVEPGDDVATGQRLARIVDLTGRLLETVLSPAAGRVIALAERVVAHPGMTVATLAVEEGSPAGRTREARRARESEHLHRSAGGGSAVRRRSSVRRARG